VENKVRGFPLALCASVFVLALAVRVWTNTWLTDFWGDSYHHWLITRLTMQHGGVYTDYKGLEVVWTPLYHYVSMIPLLLTGRGDIVPLHWMNTLLGALTCALVAWLAWRLYADYIAAFTAGALLALTTWHIAFSGMNVAEIFSGLLLVGMILLVLARPTQFPQKTLARNSLWKLLPLFLLTAGMVLTRTDLSVYLAIVLIWLCIQRRFPEAFTIVGAVIIALGGWSAWSWLKTANPLYWYQQYTHNNLYDWARLNESHSWLAFADYLARLSPFVLPALVGGVLCAVDTPRRTHSPARRDNFRYARLNIWLVTALLAGHSLFLIVGYARGIVPILTERYLVLDLPLVAVLMAGWVGLLGHWVAGLVGRRSAENAVTDSQSTVFRNRVLESGLEIAAALVLMTTMWARFQNDIPELEIRRWGIDQEWQIGNFLDARVQPGEVVLTDAPVAIYRSGKPLEQFVSSVGLASSGDSLGALRAKKVRWVATQPLSYDGASAFVPRALLEKQTSGNAGALRFELAWRYDPNKPDIQAEVWNVLDLDD
jgi:hypothetical protein